MDEQTVSIPVRQYAESIMAIQKLNDIYKITCCTINEDNYFTMIIAIKSIAMPDRKEDEQDART